jgi:hypothetical protein
METLSIASDRELELKNYQFNEGIESETSLLTKKCKSKTSL